MPVYETLRLAARKITNFPSATNIMRVVQAELMGRV